MARVPGMSSKNDATFATTVAGIAEAIVEGCGRRADEETGGRIEPKESRGREGKKPTRKAKARKQKNKKEAKKEALAAAEKPNPDNNAGQAPKTKRSFKEKYEIETLEKEIEELEVEKGTLETKLAENATDFDVISKATERLGTVIADLSAKGDRWLELSEFSE